MAPESEGKETRNRTSQAETNGMDEWRPLATAQQEFQFAADRGLMSWNRAHGGHMVVQIVMPNERCAEALKSLIEKEKGEVDCLAVRRSPSQGDRWIVQVPVVVAERLKLLPRGVTFASASRQLPFGRAPASAAAEHASRMRGEPVPMKWVERVSQACRWFGRTGKAR